MILSFYHIPILTDEYNDIIPDIFQYLQTRQKLTVTIKDVMPSFTSDMVIEIPPFVSTNADAMAPNYVTFNYSVKQSGGLSLLRTFYGFVVVTDFSTPGNIRITIRCDIVSTFALAQLATIDGVMTKSTMARALSNAAAHYSIPADFSTPDTANPSIAYLTTNLIQYRILTTVQCYEDNAWPAADGEAFQVTLVSYRIFTPNQIKKIDTSVAVYVDNMLNPAYFWDGVTGYKVISVSKIQFVPSWMLPNVTDQGMGYSPQADGTNATTGRVFFASSTTQIIGPYWYDVGNTVAKNLATVRAFIGNRHVRIPLPDIRVHNTGTLTPDRYFVRISTYAAFDGFHCEIVTDTVTDVSALFNAPYSYNSDSEMAYASGDARALSIVGAGVSGAVGVIGGTAMLASGNPMGVSGIVSGSVAVASAVNSAQYRGRDVIATGSPSAMTGLDDGIIYFILEAPINADARTYDALLNGYACQVPVIAKTVDQLAAQMPTDDPLGVDDYRVFETIAFAPGVRVTCDNSNGMPYAPAWVLRRYAEIMERGCRLWLSPENVDPGNIAGVMSVRSGVEE